MSMKPPSSQLWLHLFMWLAITQCGVENVSSISLSVEISCDKKPIVIIPYMRMPLRGCGHIALPSLVNQTVAPLF